MEGRPGAGARGFTRGGGDIVSVATASRVRRRSAGWIARATLAAWLLAGSACALVVDDQRITVSGVITCSVCSSGFIVVGLFTPSEWNVEFFNPGAGQPFATQLVVGGSAVSYAIEVNAGLGSIVVSAYYDLDGDLNRDIGEPFGYATTSIGTANVTVGFALQP